MLDKGLNLYEAFILASGQIVFYICLLVGMIVVVRWVVRGMLADVIKLVEEFRVGEKVENSDSGSTRLIPVNKPIDTRRV